MGQADPWHGNQIGLAKKPRINPCYLLKLYHRRKQTMPTTLLQSSPSFPNSSDNEKHFRVFGYGCRTGFCGGVLSGIGRMDDGLQSRGEDRVLAELWMCAMLLLQMPEPSAKSLHFL